MEKKKGNMWTWKVCESCNKPHLLVKHPSVLYVAPTYSLV